MAWLFQTMLTTGLFRFPVCDVPFVPFVLRLRTLVGIAYEDTVQRYEIAGQSKCLAYTIDLAHLWINACPT